MEIGPVSGNNPIRRPETAAPKTQEKAAAPAVPEDTAEISADARQRLADLADKELKAHGRDFAPVREIETDRAALIEAVRKRIKEGYYQRPDVGEHIADRLLDDWKQGD